jgi:hypothetical protein
LPIAKATDRVLAFFKFHSEETILKLFRKVTPAAFALAAAFAFTPHASASLAAINKTYNFSGTCADCRGFGDGILTLGSSYVPGSSITQGDFISFSYLGTDLYDPFTVLPLDAGFSVSGSLPSVLPSTATVRISSGLEFFNTTLSGAWSVGLNTLDYGPLSTWSTNTPASTPEPATFGFAAMGLTGALFFYRRRQRTSSVSAE